MIDPFASPSLRLRRLGAERRTLTVTLPQAILAGALLAAGAVLATWLLTTAALLLPLGAARLLAALAFAAALLLALACGGRVFGLPSGETETNLTDLLSVLVGNAGGAFIVAASLACALRFSLFEGFAVALLEAAAGRAAVAPEGLLLRAVAAGALAFVAGEYFLAGERPVDRFGGALLATIPLVLVGFSLVAGELLITAFVAIARNTASPDFWLLYGTESVTGGLGAAWLPVVAGNLLGSALAAALLGLTASSSPRLPRTSP